MLSPVISRADLPGWILAVSLGALERSRAAGTVTALTATVAACGSALAGFLGLLKANLRGSLATAAFPFASAHASLEILLRAEEARFIRVLACSLASLRVAPLGVAIAVCVF